MSIGSGVIKMANRLPLMQKEDEAIRRFRGVGILGWIGANGSGKSLMVALVAGPTLKGLLWSCDNPDHFHTQEGRTMGLRTILSTMRFQTPDGADHPLWVPLTDFSQIVSAEHCDLILDEVGGSVASSTSDDLPMTVKATLQELRRRDVTCSWTAPSWNRASKVLREVTQGVGITQGMAPVRSGGDVTFEGTHEEPYISEDGNSLLTRQCTNDSVHAHPSGRLWLSPQLMFVRLFDVTKFDEWSAGKVEKLKPQLRHLFWRPGSFAESSYDTFAYVEKLGQITSAGMCDHCGGTRSRPKCTCESPQTRRATRRSAAAVLADAPDDHAEHVHEHA